VLAKECRQITTFIVQIRKVVITAGPPLAGVLKFFYVAASAKANVGN